MLECATRRSMDVSPWCKLDVFLCFRETHLPLFRVNVSSLGCIASRKLRLKPQCTLYLSKICVCTHAHHRNSSMKSIKSRKVPLSWSAQCSMCYTLFRQLVCKLVPITSVESTGRQTISRSLLYIRSCLCQGLSSWTIYDTHLNQCRGSLSLCTLHCCIRWLVPPANMTSDY